MTKSIIGNLFIASVLVGALAWYLAIIEFVITALMQNFIFCIGRKVVDFEEWAPFVTDNVIINRIFETDSGKFTFVDSQRCIFRDKMSWFSLKWHTPFPLKGSVTFKNGMAYVEGRLPLGTTIFFSSWLVIVTVGGIGLAIQESNFILSMIVLLIGWGFAAAMYFPSVALEKKRLFNVYDEIKRELKC